jgi:glycosyltransferase involved in cell wall biosynthesis
MNILHVDPERGWGGGEVQVLALVCELTARGHSSLLAVDPRGLLGAAAARGSIPLVPLTVANHLDVRAGLRLRSLARGYDVVHFHTARAHALAPFCRRAGLRRVVTRRMDYRPAGGPYARFLYNHAVDRVIAISDSVRRVLLDAGVRADHIRVVPSGIDPGASVAPAAAGAAVRAEWGVPEHAPLAVLVGSLERRKGARVLLAAAAAVPGLWVVFCGDGSEAPALRGAAAPLGDRVRFAGFRHDVPACLAAADVVVLPSLHEGLGIAALEAMAATRPVVASRTGGLAEAVADGETGLLVPPGDPDALAAALARLAADPALRRRLGEAGRVRLLARFTSARMAEGTLACYEELA